TPTLFMLSTLEPRKGHALLLDAAEKLWAEGHRFNLLIAGRIGWKVQSLIQRLGASPQRGKKLFVRHDLSDAEVAYGLSHASCLVLPSQAEGLGLPILEAEQYGCPVVCTDLPVFREVAGPDTRFFAPYTSEALVRELLPMVQAGRATGGTPRLGPAAARTPADYARDILAIMTPPHHATPATVQSSLADTQG
ncbi:MAG: glycosyltransferase, partial [Beijerinckiaceae bacterium]